MPLDIIFLHQTLVLLVQLELLPVLLPLSKLVPLDSSNLELQSPVPDVLKELVLVPQPLPLHLVLLDTI